MSATSLKPSNATSWRKYSLASTAFSKWELREIGISRRLRLLIIKRKSMLRLPWIRLAVFDFQIAPKVSVSNKIDFSYCSILSFIAVRYSDNTKNRTGDRRGDQDNRRGDRKHDGGNHDRGNERNRHFHQHDNRNGGNYYRDGHGHRDRDHSNRHRNNNDFQ